MSLIDEDQVELQSIEWFKELGYHYKNGYEIAPEGVNPERDDFRQVILEERLRSALIRINPDICLLYTSPSPRDSNLSRMPSSA